MLPSGSPVSNLGSQPWAAFPTGSGQVPGAPTLSVDRLLPGVMGSIPQAYNRSTPSVNHVSTVFPSSSIHSGNGAYSPHVPLGYTVHPTSDQVASNDRSFQNVALTQSYSMQNCCTIPQTSLPYGQSMPYLTSSLLPSLCNGFLNNIPQQMTTVPPHPQAALAAAAVAASNAARNCDPLRHFGPTLMNQLNRRPRPSVTSKTNLYISGLHETDSDETLRQIVESVVQPKSCKAMTVNGKCKGYGFIDCETEKEAELAMERINEYSRTTGRKLSVKFAFENEKDKLNVFVQHLPRSDYTTDDLMELFKPFGVITSAKLLDSMKGPTGIGFVRFSSPTEAEKAIKMMNKKNLCLGENTKAVTCKLADKADAQRRNLTTSELTRNKFPFNQGQNQTATGVIPQPLHANTLPAGHIAALAQSGSLPANVLPSLPAFSFEVPGFASHSVAPSTMTSGVMPSIISGSSTLVQLPYPSAHPGALNNPCSSLPHRTNNPLMGPPPQTQVPVTAQSPQYMANLVSAYLSSMDVQQGALKTLPTAVPSNRFPNTGTPSVMFHTGNTLSTPGAQSDSSQLNPLPPNVHYALSYGQQPQQTIAPGGTTTMSPQLVWLAPTYPNSATSSMFQNYGLTPAPFHSSTLDQTKVTHESQRSTPGLTSHTNYPIDRTSIPTGATNTLTTMFQNLSVNGPLESSRFSADSMVSNEQSRTWSYPKNPKSSVDESISNNDQRSAMKQGIPVSHAFENSEGAFVDPVPCDAPDFIASSMPTSLASLDHSKHGACFGVVNSSSAEIFPSVENNTTSTNDYEIFSEKTNFNAVNGGGAVLDVDNSAPNGFQTDRTKGNETEATVDQKVGSQSDSDCVVTTPVSKPDADLMESSVALSGTTTCIVKSSS